MELKQVGIKMEMYNSAYHTQIPIDESVVVVSLYGNNRGQKLLEILRENGYTDVSKIGIWQYMNQRVKDGTIERANCIISLDPRAAYELKEIGFRPGQRLIELDIKTLFGEIGINFRDFKSIDDICDEIRQKIEPYVIH
jgi:hypothetical protein